MYELINLSLLQGTDDRSCRSLCVVTATTKIEAYLSLYRSHGYSHMKVINTNNEYYNPMISDQHKQCSIKHHQRNKQTTHYIISFITPECFYSCRSCQKTNKLQEA
jgi:hypothetical protein